MSEAPSRLHGRDVSWSPILRDGTALVVGAHLIVFGTAPWTELERARELALRIVHRGLADVLAWLGEPVGPSPDRPIPVLTSRQLLDELLEAGRG